MTPAMMREKQTHPTAARITAPGRSAIASISVDGEGALQHVLPFFTPFGRAKLADVAPRRIVFGRWCDTDSGSGEEIVVCVHTPAHIEVHCHGGDAAAARIMQALEDSGCRLLNHEQWMAAGDSNQLQREAIHALTRATTTRVAAILLDQLRGALEREIRLVCGQLQRRETAAAEASLRTLLARVVVGSHLAVGWRVVLAGRPNVGKSSLINALLGYQRAIVFDQAGTTRDVVTAGTAIDGWPVEFADTAGIAKDVGSVEAAGVKLAWQHVASADLVVFVSDLSSPWTADDEQILQSVGESSLIVHNKSDLVVSASEKRPVGMLTSASQEDGIQDLITAISQRLVPTPPQPGEAVPFNHRQTQCLHQASAAINRGDLDQAHHALQRLMEP
jgi:tRNA modification GTPase